MKDIGLFLKTNSGKLYEINWIGVADFDGVLRFELTDMAYYSENPELLINHIVSVFTNPEETKKLIRVFPELQDEKIFNGFTKFKGLDMKSDDNIVISLWPGANE